MKAADVREAVREILHRFAPEADLDALTPTDDLREALDIDSFDFLNLLGALHDRFGVEIPESDYGRVRTLQALTEYLAASP